MAARLRLVMSAAEAESEAVVNLNAFLAALTALSERHGIAISDGSELYEMERDDRLFAYHADAESRLRRS